MRSNPTPNNDPNQSPDLSQLNSDLDGALSRVAKLLSAIKELAKAAAGVTLPGGAPAPGGAAAQPTGGIGGTPGTASSQQMAGGVFMPGMANGFGGVVGGAGMMMNEMMFTGALFNGSAMHAATGAAAGAAAMFGSAASAVGNPTSVSSSGFVGGWGLPFMINAPGVPGNVIQAAGLVGTAQTPTSYPGGGGAAIPPASPPPNAPQSPSGPPNPFPQLITPAQSQRFQRGLNRVGIMGAALNTSLLANNWAEQTASGDYDPMKGAALAGGAAGAMAGIAATTLVATTIGLPATLLDPENSMANIAMSGIAGQMLGAAGAEAAIAPTMRKTTSARIVASALGRKDATWDGDRALITHTVGGGENPFAQERGWLEKITDDVTFKGKNAAQIALIKAGAYAGVDLISLKQTSETYQTLFSASMAAGDRTDISQLTQNLAQKYYGAAPQMAAMAAPVIANQNRLGRNSAQEAITFGAEAYGAFRDAYGAPDLTARQRQALGTIQLTQYNQQFGPTMVQGGAYYTATQANMEMREIAQLPSGRSSLAYAQAQQQWRESTVAAGEQASITDYQIPMNALQSQRRRLQSLPFSPGSVMGVDLSIVQKNAAQIQMIQGREKALRAQGQLTPEQNMEYETSINNMYEANAIALGELSEGMPNKLPSLSAGAPSFSRRYTSTSLAAMAISIQNSPIRSMGARSGSDLIRQNSFVTQFGVDAALVGPHSQTAGFADSHGDERLASAIDRLISYLSGAAGMNNNGQRPGDMRGAAAGQIGQNGPTNLWTSNSN